MKILALTWKHPQDPTAGGAEKYLVEVVRRWVDAGHEVTVFGPQAPAHSQVAPANSQDTMGYRYLGVGSRLTVFQTARRYLRANAQLYDRVLETVSTKPFAAHRMVGAKAVALYHQTAEEVWNLEFSQPIALLGRHLLEPMWVHRMRHAQVVANSPSTAAALGRFGVTCSSIVPPGCDFPADARSRTAPSPKPQLLWVGRLVRAKRPEDAVAAVAHIRTRFPSAHLDLVGGGYLRPHLADALAAGVTVHGHLPDAQKHRLFQCADLLLLPGTREGWGIVAMEAAAYGVPTVAYDIPGLRDSVIDGITGILVEPHSEALAAAAIAVLSDHGLWRELSEQARERARRFSWDRTATELLSILSLSGTTAQDTAASAGSLPIRRPAWRMRAQKLKTALPWLP